MIAAFEVDYTEQAKFEEVMIDAFARPARSTARIFQACLKGSRKPSSVVSQPILSSSFFL